MTSARAGDERRMLLTGDRQLARDMQSWLGLSPFAKERKLAADAGGAIQYLYRPATVPVRASPRRVLAPSDARLYQRGAELEPGDTT